MSKYTEKNAARDTKSSVKEVNKAWHQAREDASSSGELNERNENKVKDSSEGSSLFDIIKSIFTKNND